MSGTLPLDALMTSSDAAMTKDKRVRHAEYAYHDDMYSACVADSSKTGTASRLNSATHQYSRRSREYGDLSAASDYHDRIFISIDRTLVYPLLG